MKKYLYLLLLTLVSIPLPLTSQTLSLCEIYCNVFETHYLFHFCKDNTFDVFVISKKSDSLHKEEGLEYDLMQEHLTYAIILNQLDSIPANLRPIHGFNVRGKAIDTYSIGADSSCSSVNRIILFYDYGQGKFMVPLYESTDIVGLYIKADKAEKE